MGKRPLIGLTGSRHVRQSQLPGLPLMSVTVSDDYVQGVEAAGGVPVVIPYVSDAAVLGALAERLDGLLLTGGDDVDPNLYGEEPQIGLGALEPARDRIELALIHMMRAQRKPILGICRGMQVLNVALGGTLYQDLPRQWKGKLQHSQKAARGEATHSVRLQAGSRVSACYHGETVVRVNSFHHQAVKNVAPVLQAVGWDADGLVEAIEGVDTEPLLVAVQWHPENMWRADSGALGLFQALVEAAT
ncbi:putative glutamine amidotransferase [Alicyclobacillus sacchari]|uniref:Putative glutamine amidotransferase n=1 Tax=Alicyclobacillus sacchari TaxID=392010 RepID=A0A4V3HES1_9BACL|nr:gamma-glutamyl-gamma-aminobutyrate hydrolase family protein [Alicyclobacillus sacchari]TDY50001.1 putative glutamine amidotransferase [Alicyclobacillus sacchari]